jgi:hypothetical protein
MNCKRVTNLIYLVLEYLDKKYFVLNKFLRNTKFDPKFTEDIFVGYSMISKVYRIYILYSRT